MKSLQALHRQIGIQLKANYYAPYLDAEETAVIEQAVQKKKPLSYQLNLLRLLALKIIADLKRSPLFHGELRWKNAFVETETALCAEQKDPRELCQALHLADDLIETAWVTRAVRRDILTTVREQAILSSSQERQYEAIRQTYLMHHEALATLDEQIYQLKNKFCQSATRSSAAPSPVWQMVRREWPSHLLTYRTGANQIRLCDQNIVRLIHAQGSIREVYEDLTTQLIQKPTVAKIAEEIDLSKKFLQDKAAAIIHNAGQIRRTILEETQQAIEHRSQIKLAHAEKVECLLLILEKIVQLLQSFLSLRKTASSLLAMLKEAKTMQSMLENSPITLSAPTLIQKLLALDIYRQQFAHSITSTGWLTVFSSSRRVRQHQEQHLNTVLQTEIAKMTTPLYGFRDQTAIITPEQVKQQYVTADQLDEQQGLADVEREKVGKIKNTFAQ